jgi:mono/diheme cytochrome c family protein
MWNHAPAMWTAIREREIRTGDLLDEQAARDLFAFFYAARYFESPGDAARGKRLFTERRCAHCHGVAAPVQPDVTPVTTWTGVTDPIALVDAMWKHGAVMRARLQAEHIPEPHLSGQELGDILVYIRNLPGRQRQPIHSVIAAPDDGEALLARDGCTECHAQGYASIADQVRGKSLTDLAAQMWNHGLSVTTPERVQPDMRAIISYFWVKHLFGERGQPERGRKIFESKGCASCHDNTAAGAPDLRRLPAGFSAATMVAALWRHGPRMLERMQGRGMRWPRFSRSEMENLISYLNRRGKE